MIKQYKENTSIHEERSKSTYKIQGCPCCNVNWDHSLNGRVMRCVCGVWVKESPDKKNKLIRVG